MVIGMAKQAERMAGRLEEAFHFTAPQRLAAFLIGLFPATAARMSTQLPYDKCLLALSLGMTPETLSRAFLALRSSGVGTRNREIFVEDVQVLRRYCDLDD
jgi:CRP-like cAMP-binding protein